jgi:hypothetical protein
VVTASRHRKLTKCGGSLDARGIYMDSGSLRLPGQGTRSGVGEHLSCWDGSERRFFQDLGPQPSRNEVCNFCAIYS